MSYKNGECILIVKTSYHAINQSIKLRLSYYYLNSFSSAGAVQRHLQKNGSLKLSVTLRVISESSGSPASNRANSESSLCCAREVATKISPPKTKLLNNSTDPIIEKLKTDADSPRGRIYSAPAQKSPNSDDNIGCDRNSIKDSPDRAKQQNKILAIPLVLGQKQVTSPQSFKPLVAFNGLYIATSGRHESKLPVDLCAKSQTGLIAQPYVPSFDMTSVSSDDHDCILGSCCERSRFTPSSGFETPSDYAGRPDRYEISKAFELIVSEKVSVNLIQAGVIKAPRKKSEEESEDIESGDDETLLNNKTTNFRDEDSRDDVLHESTTNDDSGNASPPQTEPFAQHNQTFCPALCSKKAYNAFSLGCGDKDPIGRNILPCIYGKQYNLLTDSLRVIAQHSDFESNESKNVMLTLPFERSHKSTCDEAVDFLEGSAISDDVKRNSEISRSQYLCPGTYSPPHMESHSTRQINSAKNPVIGLSPNGDIKLSSKNDCSPKDCEFARIKRCQGKHSMVYPVDTDATSSNRNSDHNRCIQISSLNTTKTLERFSHEAILKTVNCKKLLRSVKFVKKKNKNKKGLHDNVTAYWSSNRSSVIIALAGFLLNHIVAKEVILAMRGSVIFVLTTALRILVVLLSVILIKLLHHIESPKSTGT